ncbi:MAG: hypothetical protein U0528_18250 [Anaerolineae bacterium]
MNYATAKDGAEAHNRSRWWCCALNCNSKRALIRYSYTLKQTSSWRIASARSHRRKFWAACSRIRAGDYAGFADRSGGLERHTARRDRPPLHGNFFVNTGTGTAADYLALIRLAQETVKAKFGVELELEVELMGEFA